MMSAAAEVLAMAFGEVEKGSSVPEAPSTAVANATLWRFFLADLAGVARMRFCTAWCGDWAMAASVTRAMSLAGSLRDVCARSRRLPAT